MRIFRRMLVIGVLIVLFLGTVSSVFAVGISSSDKYAWGENIGWLNWGTSEGNVDVGLTALTGYVWGENVGWISLNCSNGGSCATVDFKVSRSGSTLSGYAYGENVGWISFNCSNTGSCATVNYGVEIGVDGDFSGYAWGENIGWVSLNCRNTGSCATVDYKVLAPADDGGSVGIGFLPPPASQPGASVSPSASPVVSPTVSSTPDPAHPTPLPGQTPSPVNPLSPPSPSSPTAPPPTITPIGGGGFVQVIDQASRALDNILRRVFGDQVPPPVAAGAMAATAVAVVPVLAAVAATMAQHEAAAVTYHTFVVFGLRRKAKVWGTVYDSQTKHPVPFAKLQLLDETGHVLETRFADRDGRYGFLTNAQSLHADLLKLRIVASKDGYAFPSQKVSLGVDFIVYDHVYFGQPLEIKPDTFLSFNIPMDPVSGTKALSSALGLGLIGTLTDKLLNLGFIIGLFVIPLNYVWYPSTTNLVLGIVFFATNAIRSFVVYRPYGVVTDSSTKKPLPFALVTLNDMSGKRVAFAVSDERGRYFLPAERGAEYTLSVFTPANITIPRTNSVHIEPHSWTSRRAWVTLNLVV